MTRRLPSTFWVLWAGTLVNRAATFVVPLLVPFLTRQRGFGAASAGVALAVHGGGMVFGNLAGGRLADRYGRKRTMTTGLFLAAGLLAALPHLRSHALLLAVLLALGFVSELVRPSSQAFIADTVPEGEHARAFTMISWASNIGMPVGMLLAAVALPVLGFTGIFTTDSLTTLLFGLLLLLRLPADSTTREQRPQTRSATSDERAWLLRDRRLLLQLGCTLAGFIIYFQAWVTLPLAVAAQGFSTQAFTSLLAFNGLCVVILQPLLATRLTRAEPLRVLALAYALTGAAMAATGLAHAYVAFLSSVLGWSIGEVLVSGLEPTLVAGLAPPARRGRYMGAYGASLSTGLLVAPLAGGLYSISPSLVWVGCAGLGWVAAAIQLFGGRRLGINGPRPSSTQEADVGVTGDHASTPDGGTELAAQT